MSHALFFDSHTHVHFAAFKEDCQETIRRALGAGVGMITSGTQKDTSARAVEVAHEFENEPVFASVGLHPVHTERSFHDVEELGPSTGSGQAGWKPQEFTSRGEVFDYEFYKQLAHDPKVLAIGECGLDYYRMIQSENREELMAKQKDAFIRQIELAHELDKPFVIHCRKAAQDLIDILAVYLKPLASNRSPGIVHFFTDGIGYAKQLADMGFAFSIGGVITFTKDYDEMIKMLPTDRILTETDAPYVAPVPYRGKRNEPAYVAEVVKRLAEIRGLSVENMKEIVWENTNRVFRFS